MKFTAIVCFAFCATLFTLALMAGVISMENPPDEIQDCGEPIFFAEKGSTCTCWFAAFEGDTQKMNNGVGCNVVTVDGINQQTMPQCKTEDIFTFTANKPFKRTKNSLLSFVPQAL